MGIDLPNALRVKLCEALIDHLDLHELPVLGRRVRVMAVPSSLSEEAMKSRCRKGLRTDIRRVEQSWDLLWLRSLS